MAADHRSTSSDQAGYGCGQFLKHGMDSSIAYASDRIYAHDARLQFGYFGQCDIDRVLDRTDLGRDFVGGVFYLKLTHNYSFPDAEVTHAEFDDPEKLALAGASP